MPPEILGAGISDSRVTFWHGLTLFGQRKAAVQKLLQKLMDSTGYRLDRTPRVSLWGGKPSAKTSDGRVLVIKENDDPYPDLTWGKAFILLSWYVAGCVVDGLAVAYECCRFLLKGTRRSQSQSGQIGINRPNWSARRQGRSLIARKGG